MQNQRRKNYQSKTSTSVSSELQTEIKIFKPVSFLFLLILDYTVTRLCWDVMVTAVPGEKAFMPRVPSCEGSGCKLAEASLDRGYVPGNTAI